MPKYTDEQIKKMLGTIIKQNEHKVLNGIPNNICCLNMELTKAMRDLINRQEAEIDELSSAILRLVVALENAKSEAIKEFAERLKQELSFGKYIQSDRIDNLVKEMVGEGE